MTIRKLLLIFFIGISVLIISINTGVLTFLTNRYFTDYLDKNYTAEEKNALKSPKYFYEVEFEKPGGLIMPIIVELQFEDGTSEIQKFPAQIWRKNNDTAKRVFATEKKVVKIQIDPKLETADVDVENNYWPKAETVSKFDTLEKK